MTHTGRFLIEKIRAVQWPAHYLVKQLYGGCRATGSGVRVTDGGWGITDGGRRASDGGWRVWDGRGSERGSSGTPTQIPQNDPENARITLRYVSLGKEFSKHFPSGPLCGPISEPMDCLYIRARTFEPLFQTPSLPPSGGLKRPPPTHAQTFFPPPQPHLTSPLQEHSSPACFPTAALGRAA